MRWKLIKVVITVTVVIAFCTQTQADEADTSNKKWGTNCSLSCSCLLSEIRDLPMHRWFLEGATNNDSKPSDTYRHNNEALYEEDETAQPIQKESLGLMRTAICIYQLNADPEEWLGALPQDVQVLTLLQAPGSGQLTLRSEHFTAFSSLVALEIQGSHGAGVNQASGFHPNDANSHVDNYQKQGEIVVMSDTFKPLQALQFLNLQYVHFLGQPDEAPRPNDKANYQYVADAPLSAQKYDWNHKKPTNAHELVFLSPTDPLPYTEYKDAQERAGLSVFAGLANLLFLRVYSCGLKEVRWEMFEGLTKLKYLSLEDNQLLFIPEFAFHGTPNLKTLSLARNKILSMQFTSLAGLLELEKIDLSHNNISHLSELSLPPFPKLLTADFRHNPIEQVFAGTFEIMNATETLYLGSEETPVQIKHNSLQGLKALKRLTISNIKIDALESEMLKGLPKLKELHLQGKISILSYDAFIAVPKLEVLILNNCHIESVSMDSFYGLYGLLALDLSHNLLRSLPPGVFDQQHSLRELLLQDNQFTELPDEIFLTLPAKMIRLDGNPWHCSCAMRDWRPMSINKVKVKGQTITVAGQLDKGILKQVRETQYMFEKRVAPRCKTPIKYLNWNVFHVLRKELRCGKSKSKKSLLWRKHEEFRNASKQASLVPSNQPVAMSNQTNLTAEVSSTEFAIFDASSTKEVEVSSITTMEPGIIAASVEETSNPSIQQDNTLNMQQTKPLPEKEDHEEIDLNKLDILPGSSKPRKDIKSRDAKKLQQKMTIVKELQEKLAAKDAKRIPEEGQYKIMNNGQNIIVSKKAWKYENERLRMEKLKNLKTEQKKI